MNQIYLLPFQNIPQLFTISIAGVDYVLNIRWNDAPDAGWVFDITDSNTDESLVCNIPLITGADLLAGLEYLNLNCQMVVYTDGNQAAVPTLENLGVESNVYFQTAVPNG